MASTDMSLSLLHALRARASDTPAVSAGDATMTLRVGPELELLMVEKRLIPRRCSWSHKIPEQRNPEFVRLVLQFWQEDIARDELRRTMAECQEDIYQREVALLAYCRHCLSCGR